MVYSSLVNCSTINDGALLDSLSWILLKLLLCKLVVESLLSVLVDGTGLLDVEVTCLLELKLVGF